MRSLLELFTAAQEVGTHSGPFHLDDTFAGVFCRRVNPNVRIVRTRDPQILDTLPVLFDVGGECGPGRGRFDHHPQTIAGQRENGVPWAAAGMVWDITGEHICRAAAAEHGVNSRRIADGLDIAWIQGIDLADTGAGQVLSTRAKPGTRPVSIPTLASVVGLLQPMAVVEDTHATLMDLAYEQAVSFCSGLMDRMILQQISYELAAPRVQSEGRLALEGRVLVLPRALPWMRAVRLYFPNVCAVIYPGNETPFVVHISHVNPERPRVRFPKEWVGLKRSELRDAIGVSDVLSIREDCEMAFVGTQNSAMKVAEYVLSLLAQPHHSPVTPAKGTAMRDNNRRRK